MPNSSPGFPTLHTRTQCSQITELGQEAVCGCSSADDDARMARADGQAVRLEATLAGQGLPSRLGHAPDVATGPAPDIQHVIRARGYLGLGGLAGLAEWWREREPTALDRHGLGR